MDEKKEHPSGVIDFTNPLEALVNAREAAQPEPVQKPAETPAPNPEPTWKDFTLPDSDDLPDKFYRGKKLDDVFHSIGELKRSLQEAQRDRNLAEGRAAAAETLADAFKERQKQAPTQSVQQPAQTPAVEEMDEATWVLQPKKAQRATIDAAKQELLPETQRQIEHALEKERERIKLENAKNAQVEDFRTQAYGAAKSALDDMKVPEDPAIRKAVLDIVGPELMREGSPYFTQGGPLVAENYKKAMSENPIVRAAIQSIVGAGAQAPAPASPPGVKAAAAPNAAQARGPRLTEETRQVALAMARGRGITDEAGQQKFLDQVAERIEKNKRNRRSSR